MKIAAYHSDEWDNDTWILAIERGEEVFEMLRNFLRERNIVSGYFSGLGAADEVEVAYYNLETREYERQTIPEEVEVLSLQGNVAWKEDEMILHIHGVFGRRDLSTFGGHLFALHVSGVCEIHFTVLPEKMTRAFDDATGLNTLCAAAR